MPILIDIIEWVADKPQFWQEAVNRIIRNKNLTETDIDALLELCKSEQGISEFEFEEVDIEALKELVESSSIVGDIKLSKMLGNENINALQDNSELPFASSGITAIYGDNGSGKSSYVSILKNTCNTRGKKPEINVNLFDPDSGSKRQIAQVEYLKPDDSTDLVTWEDKVLDSNILKAIDVFDTESANHYIDGEDEIAFIPSGLSVLEKLAKCCNDIDSHLNSEKIELNGQAFDYSFLLDDFETEVSKFLKTINFQTKLEELNIHSNHTEESQKRIEELETLIAKLKATDPLKEIKENNQKTLRFQTLKNKYALINEAFSQNTLNGIRDVINNFVTSSLASKTASDKAFSNLPVENIGDDHWKKLWESARKFYDHSYGDSTFPHTAEDSSCPLCLQNLSEEARTRFQNFEEFVKQDIQEELEKASEKLENAKTYYENLNFEFEEYLPTVEELEEQLEGFKDNQAIFLATFSAEKERILSLIEDAKLVDTINIVDIDFKPVDTMNTVITSLEKRNETLTTASIDKELEPLLKEYQNLKAVKNLHKYKQQIEDQIGRLKQVDSLNKCSSKCNTRSITLFSNSITESYITNTLKDNFKGELRKMGFKNINVNAGTRGARGKQFHYLELDTSYGVGVSLKDILSEGEHRCISLATFLSELSISEHKSAIIFDDPVSSLDHRWRNKIAKRIIEEANQRQVVVFTHDITFLMMLQEHASKLACDIDIKSLTRKKTETGIPATSPPWDALKVSSRIRVLNVIHQQLQVTELNETEEVYKEQVKSFYGKLRETWERLIEEVLLNQAVQRFGRAIQTQRLKKVVDTTDEDYKTIEDNMSKCSTYFEGHDSAGALIETYPDADEVKEDIEILDTYLKTLRRRR